MTERELSFRFRLQVQSQKWGWGRRKRIHYRIYTYRKNVQFTDQYAICKCYFLFYHSVIWSSVFYKINTFDCTFEYEMEIQLCFWEALIVFSDDHLDFLNFNILREHIFNILVVKEISWQCNISIKANLHTIFTLVTQV